MEEASMLSFLAPASACIFLSCYAALQQARVLSAAVCCDHGGYGRGRHTRALAEGPQH